MDENSACTPDNEQLADLLAGRPSQRVSAFSLMPLMVFLLAMFTLDFYGDDIGSWMSRSRMPDIAFAPLVGVYLGQICLVVVVGGLMSRDWIVGLLFASLLVAIGISLFIIGHYLPRGIAAVFSTDMWGIFFAPAAIMAAAFPFYVGRYWKGWHLTQAKGKSPRATKGIEELFIVTAMVAAVLFVGRIPQVAWEVGSGTYWPTYLAAVGATSVISLLTVLPFTWVSFRIRNPLLRPVAQLAVAASVVLLLCGFSVVGTYFITIPLPALYERSLLLTASVGMAGVTMVAGFWALRWSGFRLATCVTSMSESSNSYDGLPRRSHELKRSDSTALEGRRTGSSLALPAKIGTSSRPRNRTHRWLAIGVLVILAFASSVVALIESQRRNTEIQNSNFSQELAATGSSLKVQQRKIVDLVLGPDTTDETLADFLHLTDLQSLSLADTQITDAAIDLLASFPKLRKLDLSRTSISSKSIPGLRRLFGLQELSLAGTNLSVDGIRSLHQVSALDLSNMDLTEQELKALAEAGGGSLALRGFGFSDSSFKQILELRNWNAPPSSVSRLRRNSLDLSGNPIDGSCLASIDTSWDKLYLNNTSLTDAAFGAVVQRLFISQLHISNTQLTDAFLRSLAKATGVQGLVLGDGRITETGLANAGLRFDHKLGLNSKQFTGACFKAWSLTLLELDMSDSGLNDETVKYLNNVSVRIKIDLSRTDITDAALPSLARYRGAPTLDISHTKITAEGLAEGSLSNFPRIIVAFGQYSQDELQRIRQRVSIEVGGF